MSQCIRILPASNSLGISVLTCSSFEQSVRGEQACKISLFQAKFQKVGFVSSWLA